MTRNLNIIIITTSMTSLISCVVHTELIPHQDKVSVLRICTSGELNHRTNADAVSQRW